MPTVSRPAAIAEEVLEALHGLAQATRSMDAPTEFPALLRALSQGLASLEGVLHELGRRHAGPVPTRERVVGEPGTGRSASYQVAWEMHRAAELVHQVAAGLDRAHQTAATTALRVPDSPALSTGPHLPADNGPPL